MESQIPLVAIWMVTYNHERFIKTAIESVINQKTNFQYKLFIGEDSSTDKTGKICEELKKEHPQKIELYRHSKNLGGSKNALFLYEKCFATKAKYIALLEGDDYWTDPYKLQKQVDFLEANSAYTLCFHKVKVLKKEGSLVDDFITNVPKEHETIEDLVSKGNYIHTPSVLFKNIIQKLPSEFSKTPVGDYFLYMLITQHGKIKYFQEVMAVYRYGVGIHSSQKKDRILLNSAILYALLSSYFKSIKKQQFAAIFEQKVSNALGKISKKITREDYNKVMINKDIKEFIYEDLIHKNDILKNQNIKNKTVKQLLKEVLRRFFIKLKKTFK